MNNFIKNHLQVLETNRFLNPDIELRTLFNKTSKSKREIFFSNFNTCQIDLDLFHTAFQRRINNEPIAKIFNEKDFWKFNFYVNYDVLDPRPETELIIETVEKYFCDKKQKINIVDLGTGSGCLAVSLAKEYINSKITATDISKSALKVARKNSKKFHTYNQIKFVRCDWINTEEIFDLIVANPPYLTRSEYNNLSKEIKLYEPKISLDGGENGLSCFIEIASKIHHNTSNKSLFIVEIGNDQKNECLKIFDVFGMHCIDIINDYHNCERILVFKKK